MFIYQSHSLSAGSSGFVNRSSGPSPISSTGDSSFLFLKGLVFLLVPQQEEKFLPVYLFFFLAYPSGRFVAVSFIRDAGGAKPDRLREFMNEGLK